MWEWRNYKIYMTGCLVNKTLRLRYKSVLVPLNVPAANFATTSINVIDSEDALGYHIAAMYGQARGADAAPLWAQRDDAISDMANEFVRRSQAVQYRRLPYTGSDRGTTSNLPGVGQGH